MDQSIYIIAGAVIVGFAAGYAIRRLVVAQRVDSVEQKLKLRIEDAKQEAQQFLLDAKEKATAILDDVKKDEKDRQQQLDRLADRLLKREEVVEQRSRQILERETQLGRESSELEKSRAEAVAIREKVSRELERVCGLSAADAKKELFQSVEQEYREEFPIAIQRLEQERREEIEKKCQEIITTAIQRYSRTHVADITTSVFHLKNEDLKGKIIGREGRNIRTLERLTGAEIIVDEAPESIVISSFDPLRREIARIALDKLIKDGRIQPAKIEEKVEETRQELTKFMYSLGEQAALEVGVVGLPKELIQLLGRLHFRTSYGQNVLVHSIEMAHISSLIASELGANVDVAKRAALLHDIGKAISHEVEGTHVDLGRKLLRKYKIDDAVICAMESHHEEYPFASPEAYIVAAADILSAARPGARRDTVEAYLKRLEDLEKIVNGFDGVKHSYALSAGREVRVFVVPEKVDDFGALQLAKRIAAQIQSEMRYPGEIKVNVIRELRAVEYAR